MYSTPTPLSSSFQDSVRLKPFKLLSPFWPQYPFTPFPPHHPLFHLFFLHPVWSVLEFPIVSLNPVTRHTLTFVNLLKSVSSVISLLYIYLYIHLIYLQTDLLYIYRYLLNIIYIFTMYLSLALPSHLRPSRQSSGNFTRFTLYCPKRNFSVSLPVHTTEYGH